MTVYVTDCMQPFDSQASHLNVVSPSHPEDISSCSSGSGHDTHRRASIFRIRRATRIVIAVTDLSDTSNWQAVMHTPFPPPTRYRKMATSSHGLISGPPLSSSQQRSVVPYNSLTKRAKVHFLTVMSYHSDKTYQVRT